MPDVVIDDPTHRQALDIVTRRTSMSKRALRLEAQTPKHLASYFPHSPYCDTCMRANLIQSRFHRTTPAEDDQLPATTSPEQRLSADTIIITREANLEDPKAATTGETYASSVRDRFSGMALIFPQPTRTAVDNYKALKLNCLINTSTRWSWLPW